MHVDDLDRLVDGAEVPLVMAWGYADRPVLDHLLAGTELFSRSYPGHGRLSQLVVVDPAAPNRTPAGCTATTVGRWWSSMSDAVPACISSDEDWCIHEWWRRHPNREWLWIEVAIGFAGPGDWPNPRSHRRIDAIHLPGQPEP